MAGTESSLALSNYVEPRFIKICHEEELLKLSPAFQLEMRHLFKTPVSDADRSQIYASTFLCPTIQLNKVPLADVLDQGRDLISFLPGKPEAKNSEKITDFDLLCSYASALQPDLTPNRIVSLTITLINCLASVESAFGEIPNTDGNDNPVFISDLILAAIDKTAPPTYSPQQIAVFREYKKASQDAHTIVECATDLSRTWSRKDVTGSVAIHPAVTRSYNRVLTEKEVSDISDETEIFFLAIRELQTLPVGRTLRETLELAKTPEGVAIRELISELNLTLRDGTLRAVEKILERIKTDIDEYRSLTNRLQSPHKLSRVTDIALTVGGLIPGVGTIAGLGTLAKSAIEFGADLKTREKMRSILWTQYKGTSI